MLHTYAVVGTEGMRRCSNQSWQAMWRQRRWVRPLGEWAPPTVHRPINLAAGIREVAKVYHVQNFNAYESWLKTWIRRFHGVATHFLPSYIVAQID